MKTSILEIYALTVCFATLMCFAICLGIGLYDIVQINFPEFTSANDPTDDYWMEQEIADGYKSLVMVSIIMLVDLLLFIPHWLIAKKARIQRSGNA